MIARDTQNWPEEYTVICRNCNKPIESEIIPELDYQGKTGIHAHDCLAGTKPEQTPVITGLERF